MLAPAWNQSKEKELKSVSPIDRTRRFLHVFVSLATVVVQAMIVTLLQITPGGASSVSSTGSSGYWLVNSSGAIYSYGSAQNLGSLVSHHLTKPIVSMASTPDGHGYWLVASDGGVFSFGDAQFFGSTGAQGGSLLASSIASTPDGKGYWVGFQNGTVKTFGDALSGITLDQDSSTKWTTATSSLSVTSDGRGYLISDSLGDVRSFGDAQTPSAPPSSLSGSIVGLAQSNAIVDTSGTGTQNTGGTTSTTSPGTSNGSSGPGNSQGAPRKGLPSTDPLTIHNTYRHGVVPSLAWIASHTNSPAISPRLTNSPNNLVYLGGTNGAGVITGSPKVYLIYWGSQWGTQSTNSQGNPVFSGDPNSMAPYLEAFLEGLGSNSEGWSQVMTQYCQGVSTYTQFCSPSAQSIGYPTSDVLAGVWEDTSQSAPLSASSTQLGQEAVAGAVHFGNTSSTSNLSAQYVVVSPTGTSPDGFVSAGFCAWHSDVYSSFANIAFTNLPYIPDAGTSCGQNFVNSGSAGLLDGVSIVEGHEYAETLTDPFPGSGWMDSNGYETGDKCVWIPPESGPGASQNISLATGMFAVQSTWANNLFGGAGGCEVSPTSGTLPYVDSISQYYGPTQGGTQITLAGVNFTGVTQVDFGGTTAASFTFVSDSQISAVSPAGSGTVDVTVTTPQGTSPTSIADQFTYSTAPMPSVLSLSPVSGSPGGGTLVTLSGSGFTGVTQVDFGGTTAASFTFVSDSQISAVSPAGSGTVDVTVTTPQGTSPTSIADQFTYLTPPPILSSISPSNGPNGGGTVVTLTGSGFTGISAVDFGSYPAESFQVVSSTTITAVSPPATGSTFLYVTDVNGISVPTSSDIFTWITPAAPVVSSISPTTGPTAGGTQVIIDGSGFTGTLAVVFSQVNSPSFSVISDNQISAISPTGTGTVDVAVLTLGGLSATAPSDQFTYTSTPPPPSPPVVSSISPTSGPSSGGTQVVVSGSGFTGANAVDFGSSAASGFTVVSDSSILVYAPSGTGTVDIAVTTTGGTSQTSSSDQFTYTSTPPPPSPPVVSSVSPKTGPQSGGTLVVIYGSSFTSATAVNFGTSLASFTVLSDSEIIATSPAGYGQVSVTVSNTAGVSATSPDTHFTYNHSSKNGL